LRPLGIAAIVVSSHPDEGFKLNQLNLTGEFNSMRATALGRGKQTVKAEIEKLDDFENKTCNDVM